MSYIPDTSAFVVLKHFYPTTFASLWSQLDALAAVGTICSVREVYNELHSYNDVDSIHEWADSHKTIFARPSNAELLIVQRILAIPHFSSMISRKAILRGTPVADPFVVAAAMAKKATVVTQEKDKPNSSKLPNVCAHFEVPCINLETFMKQQEWTF